MAQNFTSEQLDAAVLRYRQFSSAEEFYRALAESQEFKAAFEAAYRRDPSIMTTDASGWRATQFNVNIPPARPSVYDPFGPGADPKKIERMKPLKGAAIL
jgi:hypothetical protein